MTNNNPTGTTVFASPRFELPAGEKVEVPYNMFYFVPGTEFGDEFYEHEGYYELRTGHDFVFIRRLFRTSTLREYRISRSVEQRIHPTGYASATAMKPAPRALVTAR